MTAGENTADVLLARSRELAVALASDRELVSQQWSEIARTMALTADRHHQRLARRESRDLMIAFLATFTFAIFAEIFDGRFAALALASALVALLVSFARMRRNAKWTPPAHTESDCPPQ